MLSPNGGFGVKSPWTSGRDKGWLLSIACWFFFRLVSRVSRGFLLVVDCFELSLNLQLLIFSFTVSLSLCSVLSDVLSRILLEIGVLVAVGLVDGSGGVLGIVLAFGGRIIIWGSAGGLVGGVWCTFLVFSRVKVVITLNP